MARLTLRQNGKPDVNIVVKLADAPFNDHGKPASLLAAAMSAHEVIEHSCGGVCACSTCHVIVERGGEFLSAASEQEQDMLDLAPGLTLASRLACQAELLRDDAEVVLRIPTANRNYVGERRG